MTEQILKQEIKYIALSNLSVVWVQAQRPYDEKWATAIAKDFDPDKFDPIIVTKPNGQGIYHIIEGQHRRHALEMYAAKMNSSGDGSSEQAPCRVVADADPARAAEIWLGVNKGRKAIRPVFEFKVAVVAGREPEKKINRIIHEVGYRISDRAGPNDITAVMALKVVFNRHDATTLKNVLQALRLLWKDDPMSVQSGLLRGFGIFLHEFHSHIDSRRLRKQIGERFSPHQFMAAAKARRENTQEPLDEAIANNLFKEYNKGLREDLRLRRKS